MFRAVSHATPPPNRRAAMIRCPPPRTCRVSTTPARLCFRFTAMATSLRIARRSITQSGQRKTGILSVAVSSHDLHEGNYFVSVEANTDAPVAFRIVAMLIRAELDDGHKQHGELCPNEWYVPI